MALCSFEAKPHSCGAKCLAVQRVTSVDDFIHRVECVCSVFHFIQESQPRCLTDDTLSRHVAEEVRTMALLYSGVLLSDTATAAQGAASMQPTTSDY